MRALLKDIETISVLARYGRVVRIEGLGLEVTGAQEAVRLAGQIRLSPRNNKTISCEVDDFRDGRALVMPLGPLNGIALGARADFEDQPAVIRPSSAWLSRMVDGFGKVLDDKGPLPQGAHPYPLKAAANRPIRRVTRPPSSPNCRACSNGLVPAPQKVRAPSPTSSSCWWRTTTIMNRFRTRCAASWTALSYSTVPFAERGRFPAINVLRSVSRTIPGCNSEVEQGFIRKARLPMTVYEDMAELIRLGAYKPGTNPEMDSAIKLYPQLEAFFAQRKDGGTKLSQGCDALSAILDGERRA